MTADELRWRPPTSDDTEAWSKLLVAMDAVDRLNEIYSPDELEEEMTTPGFDPSVDGRFGFAPDGELVAFAMVTGRPAGDALELHRVQLWGGVHPEHRGKGIGRELLAWMIEHGEAKHRADHPDIDGVLEVRCADSEPAKEAMVRRAGFTPLRYWYEMVCDVRKVEIDPAEVAEGLRIEPYRAELSEAVRLAHNEAFSDHWGSTPADAERWRHSYLGLNFRPDLSFVVLDGDEVVAYLLTNRYPQDDAARGAPHGWIDYIGSRRAYRGRGLATALLRRACLAFRDAGFAEALLAVDVRNPSGALGLYERFGFTLDRRATSYARPVV
jgi:ribosomal protein S18 acetylase RimI-like enzyme